jgi:hypothetical protein
LLCVDGSPSARADSQCDVEVAWFGDCDNPENNDPTKCLDHYARWVQGSTLPLAKVAAASGLPQFSVTAEFDFQAPNNVLQDSIAVAGQTIHFGTSYVFFAACAGTLYPVPGVSGQLPVQCRDRTTGAVLGQDRFVVGYTTIYAYDVIYNLNPQMTSPLWWDFYIPISDQPCSVDSQCPTGLACPTVAPQQCVPVVPPCDKRNPQSCSGHCLHFAVNATSFRLMTLDGTPIANPQKSLWYDYYTNAGALPDDARLAMVPPDTTAEDERSVYSYCAMWQPPAQATEEARIWIVLRDDRGGLTWRTQKILVR